MSHSVETMEQRRKMTREILFHSVAHSDAQDAHLLVTATPRSHPKKAKSSWLAAHSV